MSSVCNTVKKMKLSIPPRSTKDEVWMIVNFSQGEYLCPSMKSSKTLRDYIGLFEQDEDGYSRWMADDSISWVSSTRDPRAAQLADFQDVFGYKSFDHRLGEYDKTTYTTEYCKQLYQDQLKAFNDEVAKNAKKAKRTKTQERGRGRARTFRPSRRYAPPVRSASK